MAAARWPIRIRLAKDRWRLTALVAARGMVGGFGLWTGWIAGGTIGRAVMVVSLIVLVYVLALASWLIGVRLEVMPDRVVVASPLRRRGYRLRRGPITLLHPTRRGRGRLRASLGTLGLRVGPGWFGDESIEAVVQLASHAPLIAIPTTPGRLIVSLSDPAQLLDALVAADRS